MQLELITVNPQEYGLNNETADSIIKDLPAILVEREPLAEQYKEVIAMDIESPVTAKRAKEVRLLIKNNRTKGIENWHKVNKEFFLKGGQFIDAIKRKEVAENERMETALEQIEKYQEIKEKERIESLHNQRIEIIEQYVEDKTGLKLGEMEDDVWDAYLTAKKIAFNDKVAAEKKAEDDRIQKEKEEAEQREAQRLENLRLKEEAEKREKEIEAERKTNEEKLRIERDAAKAETDRIATENAKMLKAEQEEKQKIADELKAKKDAEEDAERKRIAEEERLKKEASKLAKAPIKKQLTAWVDSFDMPVIDLVNDKKTLIIQKFEAFKVWAKSEIEKD
jgi:hypothetical protein